MMEILFIILAIMAMIMMALKPEPKSLQPIYTYYPLKEKKRKKVEKVKPKKDEAIDEAKQTLREFGYSATEIKQLLTGMSGGTADQYVQQALKKVKI